MQRGQSYARDQIGLVLVWDLPQGFHDVLHRQEFQTLYEPVHLTTIYPHVKKNRPERRLVVQQEGVDVYTLSVSAWLVNPSID